MFEVSNTSTNVDERRLVAERANFRQARHGFCGRLFQWEEKSAFHSRQDQIKWMLNFMLKPCCRNLFKIADLFCLLASSFNRTARLHTRQSWLKTWLLPIAVNSFVKMNDLRTHLTSTLWTTISGELCLNATSHFNPSRRTSISSRKLCSWYGTSCDRTRSTKPYWASRKDFGLVWKLVMDTSNIR